MAKIDGFDSGIEFKKHHQERCVEKVKDCDSRIEFEIIAKRVSCVGKVKDFDFGSITKMLGLRRVRVHFHIPVHGHLFPSVLYVRARRCVQVAVAGRNRYVQISWRIGDDLWYHGHAYLCRGKVVSVPVRTRVSVRGIFNKTRCVIGHPMFFEGS